MLYTLPYNPEVLQAYCQIDRDGRGETRLTAPQAKLGSWLGRVFDWFEARNAQAKHAKKLTPEHLEDIGAAPRDAEIRVRDRALAEAAKWGL